MPTSVKSRPGSSASSKPVSSPAQLGGAELEYTRRNTTMAAAHDSAIPSQRSPAAYSKKTSNSTSDLTAGRLFITCQLFCRSGSPAHR